MKTAANRQNPSGKANSTQMNAPLRATARTDHFASRASQLQRKFGNQAVQHLFRTNANREEPSSASQTSIHAGNELTQLQRRSGNQGVIQRQQTANMSPATHRDYREFIQANIDFLNASATRFGSQRVSIDQALFERLINNWYRMAVEAERIIDRELGGNAALTSAFRSAYTAAIRVLMSRAASAFGKSEDDLYRENSGRIPMWAWQTSHRLEPGISTPIAEGRSVDFLTGEASFSTNGLNVTIVPDAADNSLGNRAETRINISWTTPGYRWRSQGGQRIVTSITPSPPPEARIQTFYGRGVTASSPSGYGRGTTPEDIAGGQVDRRSTTLGFHEGAHGLAFIEFIENNPLPQFTGSVGMTVGQFLAARTQWINAMNQYSRSMREFSTRNTDCVGRTIDQHSQANATQGATIRIVCPP